MTPVQLYEGSATEIGTVYQNIPSRPDIPFHRGRSDWRAERICELVDVKGKTILELGCSVGTMSAVFKKRGASHVLGIDYDKDAIKIAEEIYPDINFSISNISKETLGEICFQFKTFDIVVWTSQFMWMVKQYGMEYALDFLFDISKKCNTLVFETAGRDDGSAPLDMSQEDILPMLIKNTCFQKITDHGPWNDNWSPRNVFICENPKTLWISHLSKVERIDRKTVRKTYDIDSERAYEICGREQYFLMKLNGRLNFPILLKKTSHSIEMEYAGIPAIWIPENAIYAILEDLEEEEIIHRDIQPSNILWNGKNCVLIDFAYAVQPGDVTNYHYDLGGKYKCPHGFSDEFSLRKVQQELLCQR